MELPLDQIDRNPDQPRREFDQAALEELACSITATGGVLEPIVVRPVNGRYEIVAGERRWRASKLADRAGIKAIVKDVDDLTMSLLALVENMVRRDLTYVEEAEYVQKLLDQDVSWDQIQAALGMERPHIEYKLKVLACVDEIKWLVNKGQMTGSMAARVGALSPNGQRRFLRALNQQPMTQHEQLGLIDAIWMDENQQDLPLFEETKLTEEQVQASRSFAGMIERTIGLCMKLEQMEEKAPGTLAAALATEIDRDIEAMSQLQSRLGKLRAVLQRHKGQRAGRKVA